MKTTHIVFALAVVALLPRCSCGDNTNKPDAFVHKDTRVDTNSFPAAPALGAQIDRMGRPAINTALNHAFDPLNTTKGAAKDAYNQDTAIASWGTTYGAQFATNLAIVDAIDTGLDCNDGTCTANAGSGGCGNQLLYNGMLGGGGAATASSYATLAAVTADDELYVDTRTGTCGIYLGVEIGAQLMTASVTCGGRAPDYDVMGVSYTGLAIGTGGFKLSDSSFTPFVKAAITGVPAHADVSDSAFPFLGPPH